MTASAIMLAIKIKICLCIGISICVSFFWEHTRPRVSVLAPRQNIDKVRDDEASSPAREARALPRTGMRALSERRRSVRAHVPNQFNEARSTGRPSVERKQTERDFRRW